METITCSVVR